MSTQQLGARRLPQPDDVLYQNTQDKQQSAQPTPPPPQPPQPPQVTQPMQPVRNLPQPDSTPNNVPQPPQPSLTIAEPWTGDKIIKQTSEGVFTFVGWADQDKRFEVWQDTSGKQYVRNISGSWYRGEDFAKAQAEAQKILQQVNVIEDNGRRYFEENGKWYTFDYDPNTNSYTKIEVPVEKIQRDIFDKLLGFPVNISGYNIQDIGKIAEKQPAEFTFMGVEDAVRQYKLKEIFPELSNKKYVTLADVQHVISERLEKYGWTPNTLEKYEQLQELSYGVFNNPDAWKAVEADINKQLEEARPKQEELQRLYEAKVFKQWDAEHDAVLRQQIEQQYKFFEHADPLTLATSGVGRGFISGITLGLVPHEWLPKDTGYFFESLFERYRELSLKPLEQPFEKIGARPLLDAARFVLPMTGSPLAPLLNNPDVWSPVAKEYLKGQERIELETLQKVLTPEKRLAYGLGYDLGSALGLIAFNIAASKTIEPVAQKALGKLAGYAAEHPESNLAKIAEKLHLVQREQLVPKEVESVVIREAEGSERSIIAKTRVTDWGKAEELLGKNVPESMRLSEREFSVLPLEGGAKVPVAGKGEFFAAGSEKLVYTKEGLKLKDPFAVYVKGTGEESFFAARFTAEQPAILPRIDVLSVKGKVDYAKIMEQVQGGLPRTVLLEEGDILASISRTPRIPVKETFTPAMIPSLPPLVLPPKLPMKEEERGGKGSEIRIPPKIPVDNRVSPPDISIKPFTAPVPSTRPFQAPKPEVAEFVSPKVGEFSVQAPRVEPKVAEVTAPKLGLPQLQLPIQVPKVTPKFDVPPQNIPDHPPPPERTLPKLPPLPTLGGTRDLPVTRSLRMYNRKIWEETWFGDIGFDSGSGRKTKARSSRKTGKTRTGKRGGRKK